MKAELTTNEPSSKDKPYLKIFRVVISTAIVLELLARLSNFESGTGILLLAIFVFNLVASIALLVGYKTKITGTICGILLILTILHNFYSTTEQKNPFDAKFKTGPKEYRINKK